MTASLNVFYQQTNGPHYSRANSRGHTCVLCADLRGVTLLHTHILFHCLVFSELEVNDIGIIPPESSTALTFGLSSGGE